MNKADKKVKEYLERASNICELFYGIDKLVSGDYKRWHTAMEVEIAKMIQREEKK